MRDPVIVVRLLGGLGNQLFQYAFGRAVAEEVGIRLAFDSRYLGSQRVPRQLALPALRTHFQEASAEQLASFGMKDADVEEPLGWSALRRLREKAKDVVREPGWGYHPDVARSNASGAYFIGYWQSHHYFARISDKLVKEFELNTQLSGHSRLVASAISGARTICVNVRRGDFANDSLSRGFHGLTPTEYYLDSLRDLQASGRFDQVYVFSDEPEWCNANLRDKFEFELVGHEHAGPHFTHYLYLMARCSAFIIPNSTFGWWAAWLSGVEGRHIFAPKNWFAEATDTATLIPSDWRRN